MKRPTPLFDTLENIKTEVQLNENTKVYAKDFECSLDFLKQYDGSEATFRSYRREIERLLQWSWRVAKKSIFDLKRADIENYLSFCKSPPESWIGTKQVARFITNSQGMRIPNPEWRMFVIRVSKSEFKRGLKPERKQYILSSKAIREIFTVTSSFYNYLINEGIAEINPILLIRQKSKYFSKRQGGPKIPRLSSKQWHYSIRVAEELANKQPGKHERTLFILTCLYLMYLRISELVVTARWEPQMCHFYKDSKHHWWFVTLGKGNKQRVISVSDEMLTALKRYRQSLNLTPLPTANDKNPLIAKIKGKGGLTSDREIRNIVQTCFDLAIDQLRAAGQEDEANELEHATVHWLRHTGISDDINLRGRPQIHVRDDAGHTSILTTDQYNDAHMQERYLSGKKKTVTPQREKETENGHS